MTSALYKNSALYLMARSSVIAASFLLLPLYTRLITPAEYGNICLLISTSDLLAVLFSLTIQSSVSRFYFDCKTDREVKALYSSILKFTIVFSGGLYLIVIALRTQLLGYIQMPFYPCVLLALLGSFFTIFYHLICALLQAKQNAVQLSLTTVVSSLVSLLLTVVLVVTLKDKIYAYVLAYFLGTLMRLFIFILYSMSEMSLAEKDRRLGEYVWYSCARLPVDVSSRIVAYADKAMLYSMRGEVDAGLYSLGNKIGQAAEVLFESVNKAYVPFAFNTFSRNSDTQELEKKSGYLFALYFCVTFILIVFSKDLMRLLDESYRESLAVISIVLIAYLINGLKMLFQVAMDYRVDYVQIKSALWTLSALLNIALNLLLIPRFGYRGAAWAAVSSYLAVFAPIVYFANRAQRIEYPWRRMLAMVAVSGVYMSLTRVDVSVANFVIKVAFTAVYVYALAKIAGINVAIVTAKFMKQAGWQRLAT